MPVVPVRHLPHAVHGLCAGHLHLDREREWHAVPRLLRQWLRRDHHLQERPVLAAGGLQHVLRRYDLLHLLAMRQRPEHLLPGLVLVAATACGAAERPPPAPSPG